MRAVPTLGCDALRAVENLNYSIRWRQLNNRRWKAQTAGHSEKMAADVSSAASPVLKYDMLVWATGGPFCSRRSTVALRRIFEA